jgi:hypothetical protein
MQSVDQVNATEREGEAFAEGERPLLATASR